MRGERFVSHDGKELELYVWDEVKNPRGAVQIVHGMNEHLGRYDDFARYLNSLGFVVAGDDHRAHGKTAGDPSKVGRVESGDLFEDTVADEVRITDEIIRRYALPVVVFGHSYGSFLTQSYMLHRPVRPEVKGFALCGAAKQPALTIAAGRLCSLGGADRPASAIAKSTFGAYDRHFGEGHNAWLTKDTEIVDAYNADPWVVDTFSKGFYRSFLRGMRRIYRNPNATSVKNLPVLLVCGADDGVGGYGKYSTRLFVWLKRLGIKDLNFTLYPFDRHELLNETDRTKIYADIGEFVVRCIG